MNSQIARQVAGLVEWVGYHSSAFLYGSPDRKRWHRWAVHIRFRETLYSDDVYAIDPRYFTFKCTARLGRRRILETSGWAMQDSVVIAVGEKPYFMWLGGSGETNSHLVEGLNP